MPTWALWTLIAFGFFIALTIEHNIRAMGQLMEAQIVVLREIGSRQDSLIAEIGGVEQELKLVRDELRDIAAVTSQFRKRYSLE